MANDYPWFGIGPGTFESVFQLYRISPDTYWPAQLHNDWLETRITFGIVGSLLIAAAFSICDDALVCSRMPARRPAIHDDLWLALAGCLAHARFDFPFQIYSILFLFLVLCAIAFSWRENRKAIRIPNVEIRKTSEFQNPNFAGVAPMGNRAKVWSGCLTANFGLRTSDFDIRNSELFPFTLWPTPSDRNDSNPCTCDSSNNHHCSAGPR
jgi:hypothetical protein